MQIVSNPSDHLLPDDATFDALWATVPAELDADDRWRVLNRAILILARDQRRETVQRACVVVIALGLVLVLAYAATGAAWLAAAAAGVFVVALVGWAAALIWEG